MNAQLALQLVVNGLSAGMLYLLVVFGIDLILRSTKILNFAHGQFYMIGAYMCFLTYGVLHMNYFLSLVIACLAVATLGALSYLGIFNFVQKRFAGVGSVSFRLLVSATSSVGLMMILQQGIILLFGTTTHGLPSAFPQTITWDGVQLRAERLVVILLGVMFCFGLYWLLFRTRMGKAARSVSFDAEASSLQGINASVVYLLSFIIGCALAGFAGAVIAPIFVVTPVMGHSIIFLALMVLVAGGIGSYKGAILGAVLVGLFTSFGYQFLGGVSHMLLFVSVMLLLIFRPGGILGEALD